MFYLNLTTLTCEKLVSVRHVFCLFQLDILLNGVLVDALSSVVHLTKATTLGKHMCAKLVEIIPRQMVHVSLILKCISIIICLLIRTDSN